MPQPTADEAREFHIGDILSVTSERLVSPRHVAGLYALLGWMTGESLMTHQLPRCADECAPTLRVQFPDLAAIDVPEGLNSEAAVLGWLQSIEPTHGTTRTVARLNPADHTVIDPIAEVRMNYPNVRIIAIET